LVKIPGAKVAERGSRRFGKADRGNSTAAPLPSALSPRSNSRLGFPGEPTLVGATSYKLQDAPTFKSKKPPRAIEKGRIEKETSQQSAPEHENPSGQHTIIPADLQITGDLVSPGDIRVEGVIHGDITCRTLTLTGQPVVQGSIEAETVHIAGTFNGRVQAKKVFLTKAARMAGEIHYEALEIEPGASFEGKLGCL
jgi:cytoskeletal protein CcmA (bactofilin family)